MTSLGCYWKPSGDVPVDDGPHAVFAALAHCDHPYWLIGLQEPAGLRLVPVRGGEISSASGPTSFPVHGLVSPVHAEWLGDRGFCEDHGTRYAYVTGAMATGISSVGLVCAGARAGFLSFFGAGGLSLNHVASCVDQIREDLARHPGAAWGVNLIHSPDQPALEEALVDLFLQRGVHRIEASAFMSLSAALVRYAASGLHLDSWGRLHRRNRVMAKISRPEVARHFLQPPPSDLLADLVRSGAISAEEGRLAALVPLADDITCESDSGGHTDSRPLAVLLPVIRQLRDRLAPPEGWPRPVRIGAAGGLGDPAALAAAFALGADYVVTGTVNQLARESGTSDAARTLLAQAGFADVTMAPAADMFEMGVRVQVLRRGTLFPQRASRLYEIYRRFGSIDDLPGDLLEMLERDIFKVSIAGIWDECQRFWQGREPAQLDKALHDPHHRMALIFRWYLGNSNRWAREGVPDRRQDYQIWCGPAIGAFNAWVEGSPLADPRGRSVEAIGLNLLAGAVRITRAQQLRTAGVALPDGAFVAKPMALATTR
ncbi:MAG: PfaD family polyunsaturated fatty acid/polyketide biosynthesis protein [Cyanobacteria bacterium K_Offshore_surface_m2_239]|nr:PfaD family polyunsaturated fatty acid/polyketide biosynthesis protein [Cyanobacteria bacterium K_Offshore_surface_m2_239]